MLNFAHSFTREMCILFNTWTICINLNMKLSFLFTFLCILSNKKLSKQCSFHKSGWCILYCIRSLSQQIHVSQAHSWKLIFSRTFPFVSKVHKTKHNKNHLAKISYDKPSVVMMYVIY